jgi:hypothetical protein
MALLPRGGGTGTGTGGTTSPVVGLWDFAYILTSTDITNGYFDFPEAEPDVAPESGMDLHVIMTACGIVQSAPDYSVDPDDDGKIRRIDISGSVPPLKEGDKLWVIYPATLSETGGGGSSGGGGTSNHEALKNLYPAGLEGKHNHLTDAQLAALEEVLRDDNPDDGEGPKINHEKLGGLLPEELEEGDHFHLTSDQRDRLLEIIRDLEGGESDDPDSPGYVSRGHEELSQVFPESLPKGDHFHVTKSLAPDRPDIITPLDRSAGYTGEQLFITMDYASIHGYGISAVQVEVYEYADLVPNSESSITTSPNRFVRKHPVQTTDVSAVAVYSETAAQGKGYGVYIPWIIPGTP